MDDRIEEVLQAWFGAPDEPPTERQKRWFMPNPAYDAELRTRFGDLVEDAARGLLDDWQATARGSLALVVLLDQLSRNIYRGSPRAFAQDAQALAVSRAAMEAGHDRELGFDERMVMLLPFEHTEGRGVQRESVAAFEALHADAVAAGAPAGQVAMLAAGVDFARKHADVIERFGRYPRRNAVLERTSTADELEYLSGPSPGF